MFNPDKAGQFTKKVIVKVSDYRSALIQGKFLAKKGIWVSEYRIESGLNCGGHAFATTGFLLGPVLEEFKQNRKELFESVFELYRTAISVKSGIELAQHPVANITVQGGIGTSQEDKFLREHYNLSGTGWGTPFLLVPEATTVDSHTLKLLSESKEGDVILSNYSPLGVPFYYLKGTTAEIQKQQLIADGNPGSSCPEKMLQFNTEFTEKPICAASKQYQSLKLAQLSTLGLSEKEFEETKAKVLSKDCLCVGLSNAASLLYNQLFLKKNKAVNICPGPNIINYSQIVTLKTMTDHIYGRTNLVTNPDRPHVFIAEMGIYFKFLKNELQQVNADAWDKKRKIHYELFLKNLTDAIAYYMHLFDSLLISTKGFKEALLEFGKEIGRIKLAHGLS